MPPAVSDPSPAIAHEFRSNGRFPLRRVRTRRHKAALHEYPLSGVSNSSLTDADAEGLLRCGAFDFTLIWRLCGLAEALSVRFRKV